MKNIKLQLISACSIAVLLALFIISQPKPSEGVVTPSVSSAPAEGWIASDDSSSSPKLFGIFELSGKGNSLNDSERPRRNAQLDYDRRQSQQNSASARVHPQSKSAVAKVDRKVLELESLLDDEAYLPARALAAEMAHSSSPERRIAAANAYPWLTEGMSVKEKTAVAKEVIEMLADADESVVLAATQTLESLLAEDPELAATVELWQEAIATVSFDAERESLLIKLSALSEKLSIPVLLWMQESGDETLAKFAHDYLDFVTYGDGVSNRRDAEIWLTQNAPSSTEISVVEQAEVPDDSDAPAVEENSGAGENQAEDQAEEPGS